VAGAGRVCRGETRSYPRVCERSAARVSLDRGRCACLGPPGRWPSSDSQTCSGTVVWREAGVGGDCDAGSPNPAPRLLPIWASGAPAPGFVLVLLMGPHLLDPRPAVRDLSDAEVRCPPHEAADVVMLRRPVLPRSRGVVDVDVLGGHADSGQCVELHLWILLGCGHTRVAKVRHLRLTPLPCSKRRLTSHFSSKGPPENKCCVVNYIGVVRGRTV